MKQIFLNSGTYTYKDLTGKLDLEKYILSVLAKDTCCPKVFTSGAGIAPIMVTTTAEQSITGPGAINITSYATKITTNGIGQAFTLVNGSVVGQLKKITLIVDGGDAILTPANLDPGNVITFNDDNDTVTLIWSGTNWKITESTGILVS